MALQVTFLGEAFAAGQAAVGPLPRVDAAVSFEVAEFGEAAAAQRAAEGPLAGVSLQVGLQVAGVGEALAALAAAQEVSGAGGGVGEVRVRGVGADVGRRVLGFDADPRGAGSVEARGLFVARLKALAARRRGRSGFGRGGDSMEVI